MFFLNIQTFHILNTRSVKEFLLRAMVGQSREILKAPSTHYLHSSHRDKQTTGTAPVSRKSVQSHRVRPLKYAYLNPSRKGSASFLSPRAKSLSLRQLARLAASTLYSRTSAGPHRFPPPQKKRNGCDTTNVIIFRQLTKQTEYIVTTESQTSSTNTAARISDFRSHGNPTAP